MITNKKVIILQSETERLLTAIKAKETQLFQTSKEANSWNPGRHRSFGNTQASKVVVLALKKEIKALQAELAGFNKASI